MKKGLKSLPGYIKNESSGYNAWYYDESSILHHLEYSRILEGFLQIFQKISWNFFDFRNGNLWLGEKETGFFACLYLILAKFFEYFLPQTLKKIIKKYFGWFQVEILKKWFLENSKFRITFSKISRMIPISTCCLV